MNQLVPMPQGNWKVVFRGTENTVVMFNQYSREFRATTSGSPLFTRWFSDSYFRVLEEFFMHSSQYCMNELPPPLTEFLLDGYFNKFFPTRHKIGSGGAGSVYYVRHQLCGYPLADYAVKVVPVGEFSRLRIALSEVKFLQQLSLAHHPFILNYYHCWIENFQPAFFGPEIPCLFILMEYSKYGNLENYLKKNYRKINYESKWQIFLQIAIAIYHLHKQGIIHRDLKMSNVLILDDKEGQPLKFRFVLSDFGTSIHAMIQQFSNISAKNRTGATGTIETMAPELFEQSADGKYLYSHSFGSDIWSLGVILLTIFTGVNPFSGDNGEEVLKKYSNVDNLIHNHMGVIRANIPDDVLSLIREMMERDPYLRPNIRNILQKPIVNKFIHDFGYENFCFSVKNSKETNKTPSSNASPISEHDHQNNNHSNDEYSHKNNRNYNNNSPKYNNNSQNYNIISADEFRNSVSLPLTYTRIKTKAIYYEVCSNFGEKENAFSNFKKFRKSISLDSFMYPILFCALCCIHFGSLLVFLIHLLTCLLILIVSKKHQNFLFILPFSVFFETFLFPQNSFFISLLILLIVVAITIRVN